MTTNVPPLASLGSILDRLYRIKFSEADSNLDSSADFEEVPVSASTPSPLHIQMQAAASYQVAETLADLNEEERKRYGALLFQQSSASKLNIVDLYPIKIEDFQPVMREDKAEEQVQQAVFTQLDNAEEYRQNLMPNEVEMLVVNPTVNQPATTTTPSAMTTLASMESTPSDFTRKLLAEQDDLITEIERKFQLQETTAATTTTAGTISTTRTTKLPPLTHGDSYIDRRVKKSFEFPMQHRASDVMALPNIDFANTKFNTDASDGTEARTASVAAVVQPSHPEFSTTKFYNSKELYNEMLHNKRKLIKEIDTAAAKERELLLLATAGSIIKSSEVPQSSEQSQSQPRQVIRASETTKLEVSSPAPMTTKRVTLTPTRQTFDGTTAGEAKEEEEEATTITSTWTTVKPMKYQKQLKRAKLLLKALKPPVASDQQLENLKVVAAKVKVTSQTANTTVNSTPNPNPTSTPSTTSTATPSPTPSSSSRHPANLAKSASKPIARPRILSRLQEKINSLECEIQNVPQDSHLWRGNETHELLLPIVTTEHCKAGEHCTPNVLTWEGEAEIQSGDILIVEINDAMLTTPHKENITSSQSAAHAAQVYQVTRSGHEHCDVTEGVLLDLTPLVVDGRKLVTLYDKDLTEGVNLLIVVSELWSQQCVRLKVTTKTDNCGENADCSGKGVCYSSTSMEEYECQCCSGFAGPHCEEIDACNPSPCTNNGICVDLSQGHDGNSYQCLCPYGYAGKNCQYESDPCNPAECMNGGSCVGNSTHFHCDCTSGFTGPLCQHSLNECESSPCLHGICVDQEDGFRCFCQPGFAGELCNFEYNECESNPCQNAGECIDHIGSYECRCTKGYTGNRCQIKVDFCASKPCPEGHRCIDHGNDFSCECPGGRNGPDCNQMPRTQCSVNPCTHGGTCWSSGESFYCACRPGYTGTMCEDEFVVETVVSSSEFMVDDVNARNFNDKTFGSSAVLKSPIELHNAYFAAGVLAAAIFIVAIVVTICHCKVNQTYRKFSTRPTSFIPILGFSRRPKLQGKLNKHWLSGKGLSTPSAAGANAAAGAGAGGSNAALSSRHLPAQPNGSSPQTQTTLGGQLHERPFQRHLAMNLENDMYYTVDFSENSQHSPLIQ
ncbi:uncharacterized protein LOC117779878 [Drosophila innubila]|uniref:uncharacterized protein LOC117779878 n=1 Tax=Drosophila innubila TaxID=198719 RepID=UPI00148D24FC|nr:uncharacterized protein LOC117779878 [Drosophila innubila]